MSFTPCSVRHKRCSAAHADLVRSYRDERYRQEIDWEGVTGGHAGDANLQRAHGHSVITFADWLRSWRSDSETHHKITSGKVIKMAGSIPKTGNVTKLQQTKRAPRKATAKRTVGKAVAVSANAKVDKGDFTLAQAKKVTTQLQSKSADLVGLIVKAHEARIWLAYGHKTWNDYLDSEFPDGPPLLVPKGTRASVVKQLASAGMSERAIGAATGQSKSQAHRDVTDALLPQNGAVDAEPQIGDDGEIIDAEIIPGEDAEPVTREVNRLDGGTQTVTVTPAKPKNAVINVVSAAKNVAKALEKVTYDLGALYDRDDYEENQEDVDAVLQQSIDDFATLVGSRLPEPISG